MALNTKSTITVWHQKAPVYNGIKQDKDYKYRVAPKGTREKIQKSEKEKNVFN
jgi:hypothetical protein